MSGRFLAAVVALAVVAAAGAVLLARFVGVMGCPTA